ncbi:MAG: DNA mismatch repair endonuclease MutL [Devosia sp.]
MAVADILPDGTGCAVAAPRVRRLDDRLVDKIAAGEVVERPASVVKELVENALDAGASSIDIAIEGGGIGLIRVSDDGHGIGEEDLTLSIARHCTSKIADAKGLATISTLGFRGEALPSIGAVGRLTIASRAADAGEGHTVSVEGGRVAPMRPAARAVGTTVSVRDLFFATPARRKFLKSERAEVAAVADAVKRLALSAPHVAFSYTSGGRVVRYLQGQPADRAREVLGAEFADEAVRFAAERDDVRLTGMLGLPTNARASAIHQYFFVNGRVVRDKLIAQALRAGYQDVMASGRHPMAILSIHIDPAAVDVNVHPAKADVRFRDAQAVRNTIVSTVRRQLAGAGPRTAKRISNAALSALATPPREAEVQPSLDGFGEPARPFAVSLGATRPAVRPVSRPHSQGLAPAARTVRPQVLAEPQLADETPQPAGETHPLGAAVAQVHANYILAQTDEGVVIVDQHAAHERIVYEALKDAAAKGHAPAQGLLIPEVVELAAEDVDRLAEHAETFSSLGLTIEPFGPGAVVVRETPAALKTFDIKGLVKELAEEVAEWDEASALETRLNRVAATIACHGSVRSGRHLKVEEMNALLRQIEQTPSASQCNHGRPTFIALSLSDIEKLFARR